MYCTDFYNFTVLLCIGNITEIICKYILIKAFTFGQLVELCEYTLTRYLYFIHVSFFTAIKLTMECINNLVGHLRRPARNFIASFIYLFSHIDIQIRRLLFLKLHRIIVFIVFIKLK